MKEKEALLYEPTRNWLEEQGYKAKVVGGTRSIILATGPRLGVSSVEPDVIGYKKEEYSEVLTVVEVKADPMYLFDGIGRCEVFKAIADFVYLALPERIASKIGINSLFEPMQIGVLSISSEHSVKIKVEAKKNYNQDYLLRPVMIAMVKSALELP